MSKYTYTIDDTESDLEYEILKDGELYLRGASPMDKEVFEEYLKDEIDILNKRGSIK